MDDIRVEPDQIDGAAGGLRRNADHLSAMTDYAEELRRTADGAFGSLFGAWKAGHDSATGRQAELLRVMREKLAATSEALTATAETYREVEARLAALAARLTEQVDSVEIVDVPGVGDPMSTPAVPAGVR
ncbi:MAG TPA: WXG100 family type VII secretion target [Pseudonocardiaceae bacterium]